ncbi:hypothetical protein H0Z60_01495 [Ectothiorhodospiraceae bacterium WFHF3C12]|nr:hypothetical protein [Ectothiorhodospiraceae bacterium WFHF3C12]
MPTTKSTVLRPGHIPWVLAVLLLPWLTACESVKVVPIQMARISQFEVYEQTFQFTEAPWPPVQEQTLDQLRRVNAQMDSYLRFMVGPENWQALKDRYGMSTMREELLNRELRIRGFLHSVISLNPFRDERFHFEGAGRFFLIRERTGEILLNGDFHLIPKVHPVDQLKAGFIDVDVRQIITRIPGESTHLHDTTVRYRIHIDTARAHKDVYAIDYRAAHPVYLIEDPAHERTEDAALIGHLYFDERLADGKLIDLRGRELLRDDYRRPRTTRDATYE